MKKRIIAVVLIAAFGAPICACMVALGLGAKYVIALGGLQPGWLAGSILIVSMFVGAWLGGRLAGHALQYVARRIAQKDITRLSEIFD